MKRLAILNLLIFFAALNLCSARTSIVRSGGGDGDGLHGGHRGARAHAVGSPVVIKMQHQNVSRPDVIRNSRHIMRNQASISGPERDETGARIQKQIAVNPPREHVTIVRNPTIIKNITHERRVEVVPNRYYWHTVEGMRYAHYYDRHSHWYGFYHGPNFYWTTYYSRHWWWYDGHFGRWVYWWDGYWWWPSPAGAVYVYVDNNYYPYDAAGVTVKKPEVESPPDNVPAAGEGSTSKSPDGQRMVQIYGAQQEAFLYDQSSDKPVFMKYLGQGVNKVRFSGGTTGKPAQILIDYKDGTFALFTADGDPVDADSAEVAPQPPSTPPSAPPAEAIPPAPGSTGQ